MSAATLRVRDLRVEVAGRGFDIVDDVNFEIARGEILGLAGESGCGKTTVGLAVLGHARRGAQIAGGSVLLEEHDVLGCSEAELRSLRGKTLSYVPQDPAAALNPVLRVGWQLEESLVAHDYGASAEARRARLAEMLTEVRLPSTRAFLKRYPHQLSGGQQQRVALAMAFACRPQVIVLDEPTTGLDVTTQAHVLQTVRHLCDAYGVAALYISHDLAVVSTLANRVAVMYAGRLVEMGPRDRIFRAPGHPYTGRLIDAIPRTGRGQALEGVPGAAPSPGRRPTGCFFAPRCALVIDECRHEFPAPTLISDATPVAERHQVWCYRPSALSVNGRQEQRPVEPVSAPASDDLLSVRGVSASYGNLEVVSDVDLAVRPRQCLAIVGESGSGKTTLARCIAGLHRAVSGEVALRGVPLPAHARRRSHEARREIQYVFQSPYRSLNRRKSVGEIVAQPLTHFFDVERRETHGRVVEALERVSIGPGAIERYPHELSGGERQRVAIARALVASPSLLVCDEITSALDVLVQASIINLISELQRDMDVGLIFVTHNLALTRTIAQEVVIMNEGRIVESGTVQEVFDSPRDAYTERLLADTPSFD